MKIRKNNIWKRTLFLNTNSNGQQKMYSHDETTNNIYLFLREEKKGDYEYLGRLKYLTHDKDRQNPVYFQWQLMDFDEESSNKIPDKKSIDDNEEIDEESPLGSLEEVEEMPTSKIL